MAITVFFDEAGNTGDELTNRDQPAFVLASHQIADAESAALLRAHFPRHQGQELKHTRTRRYAASQRATVEMFTAIRQDSLPIAIFAVHKRFALFQRLFDYLSEPVLHRRGIEINAGAMNIHATNAGYLVLQDKLGEGFMNRTLSLFETAVRNHSRPHLAELWRHLERARRARPGITRFYLDLLLIGREDGTRHFDAMPGNALDVAFSVFVALMAHWRKQSEGSFSIIHDRSKPIANNNDLWAWLSSPEQQKAVLGFGDFRDMPLPLNVERTTLARSHDHPGLQVADLLAGACMETCRYLLGDRSNAAYAEALLEAGVDEVANNIWPNAEWEPPEADAQDGILHDPLDFLAASPILGKGK